MLPSCKQIAEQASENIDTPLSGIRWFKMKLHMLMCVFCRRYNEQMILSSKTIRTMGEETVENEQVRERVAECYHEIHGKKG